jgi:hypothetical protein
VLPDLSILLALLRQSPLSDTDALRSLKNLDLSLPWMNGLRARLVRLLHSLTSWSFLSSSLSPTSTKRYGKRNRRELQDLFFFFSGTLGFELRALVPVEASTT